MPHSSAPKMIHLHQILQTNRATALELELEQQSRALSGKICKIEPCANAGLVAGNLRFPCGTHEHLGCDLPIESRTEIDGIPREGIKSRAVIVPQVPKIGANHDI